MMSSGQQLLPKTTGMLFGGLLTLAVFSLGSCLLGPSELQATVVVVKPQQSQKEQPCCRLGIAYRSGPGMVVLDRICQRKGRTVVHLRTIRLPGVCTYPPATILKDGKGKRYKMMTHSGLPNCTRGTSRRPNAHFTWVFQQLPKAVKKITLIELEDDATSGYSYWAWRDVDVQRCKL